MTAGRRVNDPLDRYDTHPDDVRRFLREYDVPSRWWPHPPRILEPAAGTGNFIAPLREAFPGSTIVAGDVEPRDDGIVAADFLDQNPHLIPYDIVITNPPFRLAEQFLRQSMRFAAADGTVIFLVRAAFLETKRRIGLLDEFPPAEVYFCRRRLRFTGPNSDGHRTDAAMYAWIVWRKCERPRTFIGRLI